jgi:tetratricopeptide (TPR) repeat protein
MWCYNYALMKIVTSCRWSRSIFCLAALLLMPPLARSTWAAPPEVGSYAPPLELTDLGGTARKIDWGKDTPAATAVFFFDPQSSSCLLEMSFLDSLYLRARDLGLAVYAVETRGRQPAEVSRSLERFCTVYRDPSFPVLPDPAFRAGRTYGVERAPVTFIAESHGVILNRIEGYDHDAAVAIARRLEQLLRRERGFLSPALREAGVSELEEREAETRIAALAAPASAAAGRPLDAGDRAPELEFTDITGRAGRWAWAGAAAQGLRIAAFFGGLSLESIEELSWLDSLARRGRDAGLEVLAVEAGGMDAAALKTAIEKYRRYHPDPSFPVAPDPGGTLTRAFGPWERLPQTYLLGGDGTIVHHTEGFSPDKAKILADKVERSYFLSGRPFPPARSTGVDDAPQPLEEEAPSIRNRQSERPKDERYRSSIVQADAAFMVWEFDRALSYYLEALQAEPKDLHALVRAAQICERRGEPDRALAFWERVLAVRPDHAEAARRVRELRPSR